MQKLIKTDDYLLVVDDSEIKGGDYRVNIQRGYIKLVDDNPEYYNKRNDVFKKVIAHLPLNNSPILQGVDLLPPLEEETDVEKRVLAYIAGYNKAKETYKYTEEIEQMHLDVIQNDKNIRKQLCVNNFGTSDLEKTVASKSECLPKKETVEEAAEIIYPTPKPYELYSDMGNSMRREAFKEGAKWQQERMYSEEDMIKFGFSTYCYISELMGVPFNLMSENRLNAEEWFEQFKKK